MREERGEGETEMMQARQGQARPDEVSERERERTEQARTASSAWTRRCSERAGFVPCHSFLAETGRVEYGITLGTFFHHIPSPADVV